MEQCEQRIMGFFLWGKIVAELERVPKEMKYCVLFAKNCQLSLSM